MANALNTFLDQAASGGFGSLFLQARDSARRADMNRRAAEAFELAKKRYPAEFALKQTAADAKGVTARARTVAAEASTLSAKTQAEKFRHKSDPGVIQSEHARSIALAAARKLRPGQFDALRDDPLKTNYTSLQKESDTADANQEGRESYRREHGKGQAGIATDEARLAHDPPLPISNQGNSRDIIAYRERMKAIGQHLRAQLSLGAEFVAPDSAQGKQQAALQAALQRIDALVSNPAEVEPQPGAAPPPGRVKVDSLSAVERQSVNDKIAERVRGGMPQADAVNAVLMELGLEL